MSAPAVFYIRENDGSLKPITGDIAEELSDGLEGFHYGGDCTITYSIRKQQYVAHFCSMTQTNKHTQMVRKIVYKGKEPMSYFVQGEGDEGEIPFTEQNNDLIKKDLWAGQAKTMFRAGKFFYDLDLITMKQQNVVTRKFRQVRLERNETDDNYCPIYDDDQTVGTLDVEDIPISGVTIKYDPSEHKDEDPTPPFRKVKFGEMIDEMRKAGHDDDEHTCSLCLNEFEEGDGILQFEKCIGHYFHLDCDLGKTIVEYIRENKKCPACSYFYGVPRGNCPAGTLTVSHNPSVNVAGHTGGRIDLSFNIPGGTQSDCHPKPGAGFSGANRYAYLPGSEVCFFIYIYVLTFFLFYLTVFPLFHSFSSTRSLPLVLFHPLFPVFLFPPLTLFLP